MRSSTAPARVSKVAVPMAVALDEPIGGPLAEGRAGPGADLQLHQPLGGEGDHVAQDIGVEGLLHDRAKVHHLIGHREFLGCVANHNPNPTGEPPMAAASRSLATALRSALRERLAPTELHHLSGHDPGCASRMRGKRIYRRCLEKDRSPGESRHVWMTPADQGLFSGLRRSWVRSCLRPLFARTVESAGPDVVR